MNFDSATGHTTHPIWMSRTSLTELLCLGSRSSVAVMKLVLLYGHLSLPQHGKRGARMVRSAEATLCYRRQPAMKSRPHTNHCKLGVISGNLAVCRPTQVRLAHLRRLSPPAVPASRYWLVAGWPKLS
jgi:hypothetical protein